VAAKLRFVCHTCHTSAAIVEKLLDSVGVFVYTWCMTRMTMGKKKMILSVRLDEDTKNYLEELVHRTGSASKSQLIKTLILERWSATQPGKTFLQRRGGHPAHLLNSGENLSDRQVRKQKVADYLERKWQAKKSKRNAK